MSAQACAESVAVSDRGSPVPRHCTCHPAPAVLVCQMTVLVLAAPGPAAGWPISQPSAPDGKARSAYVGPVTDDKSGSVVTAAGFAALLASALRAVAETDATGRTSGFVADRKSGVEG